MKKFILLISYFLFNTITYSQSIKNEAVLNEVQKNTFVELMNTICDDIGHKHTYINKLKTFKMIDDEEKSVTTYKYLSQDFNFFISVLNEHNGLRFNSPNSFLYDIIVSKGKFIEVHKEDNTSFLVYELLDNSFLLTFSTDNKGRKHYIIDSYCIK